jgi:hypothetical protein
MHHIGPVILSSAFLRIGMFKFVAHCMFHLFASQRVFLIRIHPGGLLFVNIRSGIKLWSLMSEYPFLGRLKPCLTGENTMWWTLIVISQSQNFQSTINPVFLPQINNAVGFESSTWTSDWLINATVCKQYKYILFSINQISGCPSNSFSTFPIGVQCQLCLYFLSHGSSCSNCIGHKIFQLQALTVHK